MILILEGFYRYISGRDLCPLMRTSARPATIESSKWSCPAPIVSASFIELAARRSSKRMALNQDDEEVGQPLRYCLGHESLWWLYTHVSSTSTGIRYYNTTTPFECGRTSYMHLIRHALLL